MLTATFRLRFTVESTLWFVLPTGIACKKSISYHAGLCFVSEVHVSAWVVTSPAGAVAKYCNEHVCVCVCLSVCLSASISPEQHARSLPNVLCMLPMAVVWSSSGGVTQSQGDGAILGVFFPIENALYGPYSSMNFATKDRFRLN